MERRGSFVIKVCSDLESLAQAAAEIFVEQSKIAIIQSKRFSVVLSGGNTPLRTYELLGKEPYRSQVDWSRVYIFWGDERCVPPSDARSNYGMAYRSFLSHVPIPTHQIHPILCTRDPEKVATQYQTLLTEYFASLIPSFDLVFLGLGKDGHTASLFPDSSALNEKVRWVTHVQNAADNFARITLTSQLLNQAQLVVFLVTGQEKAVILKEVLAPIEPSHPLPARSIHPIDGKVIWLVDSSAYPSSLSAITN